MDLNDMNTTVTRSAMNAARRSQIIASSCPMMIGLIESKKGEHLRLTLKYDSLNKIFITTIEIMTGKDALGEETWTETKDHTHLGHFLALTSVYSLYSNVSPDPADGLIEKGNTLVEYIADLLGSEEDKAPPQIEDKKIRGQLTVLLEQYRAQYQQLKVFLSRQLIT